MSSLIQAPFRARRAPADVVLCSVSRYCTPPTPPKKQKTNLSPLISSFHLPGLESEECRGALTLLIRNLKSFSYFEGEKSLEGEILKRKLRAGLSVCCELQNIIQPAGDFGIYTAGLDTEFWFVACFCLAVDTRGFCRLRTRVSCEPLLKPWGECSSDVYTAKRVGTGEDSWFIYTYVKRVLFL